MVLWWLCAMKGSTHCSLYVPLGAGALRSSVCSTAMVCRGSCVTQTRSSNHRDGVHPVVASDLVAAPG